MYGLPVRSAQSQGVQVPLAVRPSFLRQCQLGQVLRVASPGGLRHPVSLSVPLVGLPCVGLDLGEAMGFRQPEI